MCVCVCDYYDDNWCFTATCVCVCVCDDYYYDSWCFTATLYMCVCVCGGGIWMLKRVKINLVIWGKILLVDSEEVLQSSPYE